MNSGIGTQSGRLSWAALKGRTATRRAWPRLAARASRLAMQLKPSAQAGSAERARRVVEIRTAAAVFSFMPSVCLGALWSGLMWP